MDDDSQNAIGKYRKFKKVDGATYRKVNQFLRKRTYITAREWALARLCTDFRTSGGAEMTFIGKHLTELVPFMEEPYSPQAVNQARHSFKKKVRKASATFFYGAMCGFFTTDELDDLLFEASEVSRFLLEVEGTTLDIDEEIDIEDRITRVMRSVGETAKTILTQRSENTSADTSNPHAISEGEMELPDNRIPPENFRVSSVESTPNDRLYTEIKNTTFPNSDLHEGNSGSEIHDNQEKISGIPLEKKSIQDERHTKVDPVNKSENNESRPL
ncbi:DUF5806 family protein [Methanoregula sp.]|uniref:DUF5806 family protein n=1 Tax=Methanoregula sp. TaxID=2052170 RepID=UPI002BE69C53|nr:DUF5806 family protein [Methanoregula sp.]HVP96684.1 DUF5806 family protein [Methanoregula sp.]